MSATSALAGGAAPGLAEDVLRPDRRSRVGWMGWIFLLPALVFYVAFVLLPLVRAFQYSFYDWNGVSVATPVGFQNYITVFTDPQLFGSVLHAFFLIIFFTLLPLIGAILVSSLLREIKTLWIGTTSRTLLFMPQVIPGAAAALAWTWMFSTNGLVNQILRAVGLGDYARAWLGDFTWALPSVGVIGFWINMGFCIVLLLAGIGQIDESIYEAARLDGAGFFRTLFAVTLPGLRQQIGVATTMTIISALASFDIVFMSTQGGPGYSTMVPGVLVYQLAFTQSRVGMGAALAIILTLLVLLVVIPLQRIFNRED